MTVPAPSPRSTRSPPPQRISPRQARAAIEILLDGRTAENLDEPTLLDAGKRASALTLESATKRATIRLNVLGAALDWLEAGNTPKTARLLGADFDEPGIRTGMEQCYRALAHETTDMWERIDLGGKGECDPAEDQTMSGGEVTCMRCGATVVPADRFCESCGTVLSAVRRVAVPGAARATEDSRCCADCGDGTYVDEYCAVCGQRRAEPDRDQAELDGIVLVTDRGLEHPRNEDAAAAGIVACAVGRSDRRRRVRRGVDLCRCRHGGEEPPRRPEWTRC